MIAESPLPRFLIPAVAEGANREPGDVLRVRVSDVGRLVADGFAEVVPEDTPPTAKSAAAEMVRIRITGLASTVIDGRDVFPGDIVEVSEATATLFTEHYRQAVRVEPAAPKAAKPK
jgi:hypothetical protein